MYDLIIRRGLNKKKVTVCIILLIFLVTLATISGIRLAEHHEVKKQAKLYEEQQAQIRKEEEEKQRQEELAKQAEINKRIEQTSRAFTDEEKDRIKHIYRSTGEKRVFLTFSFFSRSKISGVTVSDGPSSNVKNTLFSPVER